MACHFSILFSDRTGGGREGRGGLGGMSGGVQRGVRASHTSAVSWNQRLLHLQAIYYSVSYTAIVYRLLETNKQDE